jgi:hypothetical protein
VTSAPIDEASEPTSPEAIHAFMAAGMSSTGGKQVPRKPPGACTFCEVRIAVISTYKTAEGTARGGEYSGLNHLVAKIAEDPIGLLSASGLRP